MQMRYLIYIYELKAKLTECKTILSYFLFFSIILLTCLRYAFKEIILVKLLPFQNY